MTDRIKIKICGLTRPEDVLFLQQVPVDFAGFIFVPKTPRFLNMGQARTLAELVPEEIRRVGVFMHENPDMVLKTLEICHLDILQFHGSEPPEYCEQFGRPYFKVVRIGGNSFTELPGGYRPDAFLLDTFTKDAAGGTGRTCDWSVASRLTESGLPIMLAGGLTPENVRTAIDEVRPWGVDVSSGVECAPGIKDHDKIRAFVREARS